MHMRATPPTLFPLFVPSESQIKQSQQRLSPSELFTSGVDGRLRASAASPNRVKLAKTTGQPRPAHYSRIYSIYSLSAGMGKLFPYPVQQNTTASSSVEEGVAFKSRDPWPRSPPLGAECLLPFQASESLLVSGVAVFRGAEVDRGGMLNNGR